MAASTEEELPQFTLITNKDLEEFMGSTDSENTKKQIKYGLSIFKDFNRKKMWAQGSRQRKKGIRKARICSWKARPRGVREKQLQRNHET